MYCKVTVDRGHRFPGQIKLFPQREPPILLETNTGCPWWTRCYYLASQPASHREKKNLEGVELLAGLWAPSTWNNATTKISVAKRGSLLQFKRLLFSLLLILSFLVIKILEVGRVWGQSNNVTDYQRSCDNRLCLLKKVEVTRYTGAIQ